ncbi:NADH dehydrogenase subunit 3 (NADH-ubiquinone oxidoreductase chain 3), partial [Psidium guajava]
LKKTTFVLIWAFSIFRFFA